MLGLAGMIRCRGYYFKLTIVSQIKLNIGIGNVPTSVFLSSIMFLFSDVFSYFACSFTLNTLYLAS